MNTVPFSPVEFAILVSGALLGAIGVLPYISTIITIMNEKIGKPLPMPMSRLLALSFVQNMIMLSIASGVGLLLAHSIGLGAPIIEAAIAGQPVQARLIDTTVAAVMIGVVGTAIILLLDFMFMPHLPEGILKFGRTVTPLQKLGACFFGGIAEELLMRLFLMSLVAWLLSRFWPTETGLPTAGIMWFAIIVVALLFGIGHLPAARAIAGKLTAILVFRTILLNAILGIVFGWLYWQHGLEPAIIAHFVGDLVIQYGGGMLLKLNDQRQLINAQPTPSR